MTGILFSFYKTFICIQLFRDTSVAWTYEYMPLTIPAKKVTGHIPEDIGLSCPRPREQGTQIGAGVSHAQAQCLSEGG